MPWDFIGNEGAVAALARDLASGRPAHAYLFLGPPRVGRRTLALRLAQALNCTGPEPPCGGCSPCRRTAAGLHADLLMVTVEADEGGPHKAIQVGQVREVERAVALKPFEGQCRVVIIDPADAMNSEAQNAFLKTLEEPPPQTAFLLVAAREGALLPTIRSRCRRIELRPLPPAAVEAALRERGPEREQARLLARLSGGRIGWALEAAADPAALERRRQGAELARALPAMPLADRFDLAERLAEEFRARREPLLERLEEWRTWWRDVLLVQAGAEEGVTHVDMLPLLREDAARYPRRQVVAFLRALLATPRHLEENVQPRLALEALLLETPAGREAA